MVVVVVDVYGNELFGIAVTLYESSFVFVGTRSPQTLKQSARQIIDYYGHHRIAALAFVRLSPH